MTAIGEGRNESAIALLADAATTERALGYSFDATVLELELATALHTNGEHTRAESLQAASNTFMQSIGCVNPL